MIIPPVSVIAAIPWLKQQPDNLVFLLTGTAAAVTVLASFAIALLADRSIDEWQRSNARFSSQWGWTAGAGIVAILLAIAPFRDWIVPMIANLADVPEPDHKLVVLAFTFGFGAVVLTQGVCTTLLSVCWTLWMSRSTRDPS